MATNILPDTHRFITKLKTRGFSEEQATGFTEAFQEEVNLEHLATKNDIEALKSNMREMELRLINTLTNRIIAVVSIGVAILALIKFL